MLIRGRETVSTFEFEYVLRGHLCFLCGIEIRALRWFILINAVFWLSSLRVVLI